MADPMNWIKVAESGYPWEREALEFVRARFPTHEPYRAWEQLRVHRRRRQHQRGRPAGLHAEGFFLIEIKSRPGRLFGDAGTWTWETEGRLVTTDNPLIAANTKAKKLRSLLQRQRACKNKGTGPVHRALDLLLGPRVAAANYRGRRPTASVCAIAKRAGDIAGRPGILAAIMRRECPGLEGQPEGTHDRPTAKMVSQAMEQAGIRPSQRHRKVSDYLLEHLIGEGPGYQDWLATHVRLADIKRRVRLYHVRTESSKEDRAKLERAARENFSSWRSLQHPGDPPHLRLLRARARARPHLRARPPGDPARSLPVSAARRSERGCTAST